ncbi:MAG: prepilin-type N-terminal cleavage/methylation domain-containing protein [Pseudomonadales bacterium]|nr:prepilin-type N-terminal cleavage/methylation domain-containing protein [Pseudomonadales bacterium]
MRSLAKAQHGFTMIELIIVIVISSILGIGSVLFISRSTEGLINTGQRQQLAATGWIISEKFSRQLRSALPHSVRINNTNSCIEFIPTVAASEYITLPGNNTTITAIENSSYSLTANAHRAAVYPIDIASLYTLPIASGTAQISPLITASTTTSGIDTFTLATDFSFSSTSPTNRIFFIEQPVIYCFFGSLLLRDRLYGFDSNIGDSFNAATAEVLASHIQNGSGLFSYNTATLTRNAVVQISFTLQFAGDNESHTINTEVQMRNVP